MRRQARYLQVLAQAAEGTVLHHHFQPLAHGPRGVHGDHNFVRTLLHHFVHLHFLDQCSVVHFLRPLHGNLQHARAPEAPPNLAKRPRANGSTILKVCIVGRPLQATHSSMVRESNTVGSAFPHLHPYPSSCVVSSTRHSAANRSGRTSNTVNAYINVDIVGSHRHRGALRMHRHSGQQQQHSSRLSKPTKERAHKHPLDVLIP